MNIKNIITKIFSLTLIFGVIFFGISSVFAACENNMSTGSAPQPGNAQSSGSCRSYATNGTDRYNNQQDLDDDLDTQIFLKVIGKTRSACDAGNVLSIQDEMQKVGGSCSTCKDGKAGTSTRSKLKNNCLLLVCEDPLEAPTDIYNGNLLCEDGFVLNDDNCCEEEQEPVICNNPPVITVEGGDTYNSNPKVVTIDYSSNSDPDGMFGFGTYGDLTILGANKPSPDTIDTGSRMIVFTITSYLEDTITITAGEGLGKIGENDCPSKTKILTRGNDCSGLLTPNGIDCCMARHGRENCENESLLGILIEDYGSSDFGFLDGKKCELFDDLGNDILEYEFCPGCDKAPNPLSGGCIETYGSGWKAGEYECCVEDCETKTCDPGEKVEGCECVCDPSEACCGIQLNTVVPFIGDCIEMTTQNNPSGANGNTSYVNQLNAFPFLMMGLSKILVTVILIFSFMVVIGAGLMMVTGVFDGELDKYSDGVKAVKKIIVALILLGSSGLILKLINPTFFGG